MGEANHREESCQTFKFKMGGPKGAVMFSIFFTVYTFYITAKCQSGKWDVLVFQPPVSDGLTEVAAAVTIWFLAQCILYIMSIGGKQEPGVILSSGERLMYNTNALFVLIVNILSMVAAILLGYDVRLISGSLVCMFEAAVLLCFMSSLYLYIKGSSLSHAEKNPNGCSGRIIYDWFMGLELNPRWRSLDVKYVLFRSAIIGWILLNICNLVEYWMLYKNINTTLVLLNAIQLAYVVDYFWFEGGVIVSRDIVHEGLGYNILVQFIMIPFCFCVQTRYVLTTDTKLPNINLCLIAILYVVGYYIYRASNSEKNSFRKNPNDPKLHYLMTMPTSSGKQLLISSWWGMCRHPNYLGDLMISLSYALCTGFSHLIPYLGTIFLVLLLLDREKQDSEGCKQKYGADWDKYCRIVKYRIIPGIY
ncbi:delta(14)-sterol reductase TM7SF2-like [Mercenaria mercenaria]|uniref:delta(14)-sterol reductase TM7SF2-like n=1 Tax=Mercenaria mercenaria TaxID=6596 RepID=UPI00234E8A31|nr:delta(14)-sterol reductase TM7SF2-like [Mercenaria mercenaria]